MKIKVWTNLNLKHLHHWLKCRGITRAVSCCFQVYMDLIPRVIVLKTVKMKIQRLILYLIIVFGYSILFNSCTQALEYPKAINGILDLKHWNFSKYGSLPLTGEWKFKWLEDGDEYRSIEYDDSDWDTFTVPGLWSTQTGSPFGYGWLRLKIINIEDVSLALYIVSAWTSYELYINDTLIQQKGLPGKTRELTAPFLVPDYSLIQNNKEIVVAWKIANFHFPNGGPKYSPRIGPAKTIINTFWIEYLFILFLLGSIFMMGIYHCILWCSYMKEKANLYFFLFCLFIVLRLLTINRIPIMISPTVFPFILVYRIEQLTMPFSYLFFVLFIKELFPDEMFEENLLPKRFPRIFYYVTSIIHLLFALFTIVSPLWISLQTHSYYHILYILGGIWILYIVIKAVIRKRMGAGILLSGFILILTAVILDILSTKIPGILPNFFLYGILFFILANSTVLSLRFTNALKTSEYLSNNLQKEVQTRTEKIKEQNKEMKRLHQEKVDYFINLAHETKTPLTLISNYLLKYIHKKGIDPDLKVMMNNITKLKNDMVNFLDYEKLEKGQVFYSHNTITDVSTLLVNKVTLFKESVAHKGITMESDVDEECYVRADPYAIDRIFNNLLDNALKYTPSGGKIILLCRKSDKKIICSVQDTGIGISEEQLDNIFKPYYQLSHQKRNLQGIGMGLNIIKQITNEINASIQVKSTPGKGSVFTIEFIKCKKEKKEQTVTVTDKEKIPKYYGNLLHIYENKEKSDMTILIVEDNQEMLAFLTETFMPLYNVLCAQNGKEALEKLENHEKTHLILSDIMMDTMDGYEFYDKVKEDPAYCSIPFIFLTAKTAQLEKLRALKQGVIDFIQKPFNVEELIAKVSALIELQEKQRKELLYRLYYSLYNKQADEKIKDMFTRFFKMKCSEFDISPREKDILLLLIDGKKYSEIADALNISENTVRTHVHKIYEKCNVSNKTELACVFRMN